MGWQFSYSFSGSLSKPDLQLKIQILNEKSYESVDNLVEDINTGLCDDAEQSIRKII